MTSSMYQSDLLNRRRDRFCLWWPGFYTGNPTIHIGTFDLDKNEFKLLVKRGLKQAPYTPGLLEYDFNFEEQVHIPEGVYHYFFEIGRENLDAPRQRVTDPLAFTVDYGDMEPSNDPEDLKYRQPYSVVKYRNGKLWPCDEHGNEPTRTEPRHHNEENFIPSNNKMVIYELPTSWVKRPKQDGQALEVDIGTFLDVCALFDKHNHGDNFRDVDVVAQDQVLAQLGVNALQLLPTADAKFKGTFGYATANYFAVDRDLGTAGTLVQLVNTLHSKHIRFIIDVVMGFGHDPYVNMAYDTFHIKPDQEPDNPDSYQSGPGGHQVADTYDPESGKTNTIKPAWVFHKLHLERWMKDFGIDGIRIDSELWKQNDDYNPGNFMVCGEELSIPLDLIRTGCLDALWNRRFQTRVRAALLGEGDYDDDFEWTVRKMLDCKLDGFTDMSQAINYVTSHDVAGRRCERLYNFFENVGIIEKEQRAKLAFACLMTAVRVPMIFAGEEFCDEHDLDIEHERQVDPVNYERLKDPWRRRVFDYVGVLVRLRQVCPSLQGNDLEIIHTDFREGRRIMTWKREAPMDWASGSFYWPVIVVANFSDQATPGDTYDAGKFMYLNRPRWREVTEHRWLPQGMAAREAMGPWQVRIYVWPVSQYSRGGPYVPNNYDDSWEYSPQE
ncbi:glycoside hydrolase family 13 protein [Zalerion maritima]|uniref:Glycoside hydrolase family 13 protein n=1 Tax=Zalerion maritima TaxID=339359 RepID=A0AAD5WPZ7_9PEZI|nr:glycoside hydrolase family 13 protein [Zalerion maritima]